MPCMLKCRCTTICIEALWYLWTEVLTYYGLKFFCEIVVLYCRCEFLTHQFIWALSNIVPIYFLHVLCTLILRFYILNYCLFCVEVPTCYVLNCLCINETKDIGNYRLRYLCEIVATLSLHRFNLSLGPPEKFWLNQMLTWMYHLSHALYVV